MMPSSNPRSANRSLRTLFLFLLGSVAAISCATAQPAPIRVAIVGLVHGHVEGFLSALPKQQGIELVGIAEPDQALAARYAKKYALPATLFFPAMEPMIEARHPQAVLVYTAPADHAKVIETAARYGVSSMVEKPFTLTLEDALAVRRAAREHHVHVLVNYETTWYSSNRAAYYELTNGHLGDLRRVVIHDGHQGPAEIGVPPEFLKWLNDPAQGGAGALYDFGCYGVDLMTWLMHGQAPLTVTAVTNHDKPNLYPIVDDDATIVLAYPHAQAVLQASWNWPFARKDMEVYGATGYAITVGSDKLRLRHQHDSEEETVTPGKLPTDEAASLNYLAAVLRGQIQSKGDLTALDTNVIVMQVLDAARESARTGKTIKLSKLED